MERRSSERIPTNLYVKFSHNEMLHTGIVTDLSDGGMGIETKKYIPLESKFDVLVPSQEAPLRIPVTVSRLLKKDNMFFIIGIQLLNEEPPKYKRLVENLRSAFMVLRYPLSNISLQMDR